MVRLRRFGDVVDATQSAFGRYALNVARISGDLTLVGTIFVDVGYLSSLVDAQPIRCAGAKDMCLEHCRQIVVVA